jgi:hypothetical protein
MAKSKSSSTGPLLLGAGAGILATNTAGGTPECSEENTTFYCNSVKYFNLFKMLLFVLIIIAIIAFIIWHFTRNKAPVARKLKK